MEHVCIIIIIIIIGIIAAIAILIDSTAFNVGCVWNNIKIGII